MKTASKLAHKLAESETLWTTTTDPNRFVRRFAGFIFLKEFGSEYFGGYKIRYIRENTRIGKEWLASAV